MELVHSKVHPADQVINHVEMADTIGDACNQIAFISSMLAHADNGVDLCGDALTGFGGILDGIQEKLERCRINLNS